MNNAGDQPLISLALLGKDVNGLLTLEGGRPVGGSCQWAVDGWR